MNNPKESTRYPYTFAADFIRMEFQSISENCHLLSRSEAAQLTTLYADTVGITHQDMCAKLADRYIEEYGSGQ